MPLDQMIENKELYFCGELDHSKLPLVMSLAADVFSAEAVSIYKSQFDGSERLMIRTNTVRIDTQMGSDSLVSGLPGSTVSEATGYLQAFAKWLDFRSCPVIADVIWLNHGKSKTVVDRYSGYAFGQCACSNLNQN